MNRKLLERLRCPIGKCTLSLAVIQSDDDEVVSGVLYSTDSRVWYPIINSVPVMLTFRTRLVEGFATEHRSVLDRLTGVEAPNEAPTPGEVSIQTTFTEEWVGLADDEVTFVYTDEELVELHRDIWLHLPDEGDPNAESVLDIGCGYGREAEILSKIFPNADIVAVDLNLGLLQSGPSLRAQHRIHPVIASLFRLPFDNGSFDHVHCQGVLHHTFSTKLGFQAISTYPRVDGSLFVWVYARDDYRRRPGVMGALVGFYFWLSHLIGRPVLSRVPGFVRNPLVWLLSALLHPMVKLRSRHRHQWRFRNTLHTIRDAFTPRFAHLHQVADVEAWFLDSRFTTTLQSGSRYRKLTGRPLLGVGMVGRKLAGSAH